MRISFSSLLSLLALFAVVTVFSTGVVIAERPDGAQKSPWQLVRQQVGDSLIEMEYSRPGIRGRTVWGELVPYGEVWRAGANERTVIEFEHDVLIQGEPLKAGAYGLLVIPTETEWTFIFSKNFMAHGSDGYTPENDALRVISKPLAAEHEEWMRYEFTGLTEDSVQISLHWEKVRCGFSVRLTN